MTYALAVHVAVSTIVLLCALAAAAWIRPLTARTRHAILLAGMAALIVPPALFARIVEKSAPVQKLAGAMPRFPTATMVAATQQTTPRVSWLAIAWLSIAVLLLLRWIIVTQRLNVSAVRIAAAPPARAVAALDAARRRIGLHRSIDLIVSPLCEAPAVIRVLRPVIVLPLHGCDALDDEELQSLLCHECAHVARRDNLFGVLEAVVHAVFWFNPVVWLARRQLAITREAACDELVADTATRAETYVGALAKFCSALIAPRIPAVSCMASAHLKERIKHIMQYDSLKSGALSHRAIAVAASLVVALFVAGAGIATATPETPAATARYQLNYTLADDGAGNVTVQAKIVNTATNEVVGEPTIISKNGEAATADITRGDIRLHLTLTGSRALELLVYEGDEIVQRTGFTLTPSKPARAYTGDKISLNLKDADLKDVLKTFASLTGLEITTDPDVSGKVTMEFKDTPWDEALDRILQANGLTYSLHDNKMHVIVKH